LLLVCVLYIIRFKFHV